MNRTEYWQECISEAFEDAEISATKKQIANVVEAVEGGYENIDMAFGVHCIPNPLETENKELQKKLKKEKSKEVCDECKGSKRKWISVGTAHETFDRCWKCDGTGMIYP